MVGRILFVGLVMLSVLVLVLLPAGAREVLFGLSCATCNRLVSLQGPGPTLLIPLGVDDDLADEELCESPGGWQLMKSWDPCSEVCTPLTVVQVGV